MKPLDKVVHSLWSRARLAIQLKEAEEAAAQPLPWYSFLERRVRRMVVASLQVQIAECDREINDACVVQRLADTAAGQFWERAAKTIIPDTEPYGAAAEEFFDQILDLACKLRTEQYFRIDLNGTLYGVPEVPEVQELVSRGFMQARAHRLIRERDRDAAPALLDSARLVGASRPA